jgi:WD40 repeat protein
VRRNPAVTGLTAAVLLALVAGAGVSALYAVRADDRAAQAARSEGAAREQEAIARQRETAARDTLCRSDYEQARALRLAGRPGWRAAALDLIAAAADLRARPRAPDDPPAPADRPTLTDLRSEAVMALVAHDARPVRQVPLSMLTPIHFSPDGRYLLITNLIDPTAGKGEIRVVDLKTGEAKHRIKLDGPKDMQRLPFFAIGALAPDGSRIACTSTEAVGAIDVRELPTGRVVARLTGPTGKGAATQALWARFSHDGRHLIAVRTGEATAEATLWDLDRPAAPRVLARHDEKKKGQLPGLFRGSDMTAFPGLRFSPDGTRVSLPAADRKAVRVLDITADPPAEVAVVPAGGEVVTVEWHPHDPVLAVARVGEGGKPVVFLWDLAAKKVLATVDADLPAGPVEMTAVAFSPDGRFLAVGSGLDQTVRVFGARDGAERFRLTGVTAVGTYRVFWTPAGELAVAGLMETLRVWRPDADPPADVWHRLGPAGRPAFSPDGRWLAAFTPSAGRTANAVAAELAGRFNRPNFDRITLIDRRTGTVARTLPGLASAHGELRFSPDGRRLMMHGGAELAVWDTETGAEVVRRKPPAGASVWQAAFFLPDGRPVGVAVRGPPAKLQELVLWDAAADRLVRTLEPPSPNFPNASLAPSPDGAHLYVDAPPGFPGLPAQDARRPARLIDLTTGQMVDVPRAPGSGSGYTMTADLAPGGGRLLAIEMPLLAQNANLADSVWTVRALPSGREVLRIPNHSFVDDAHGFGPAGRLIAVGSDRGQAEVWDVDAKELLFRWQPHGGKTVTGLSFGPEGDIATVSEEDDRLAVLRMKDVRERLADLGLGW